MASKTKITVVGSGYVGMSLSILLAQRNDITVIDIGQDRADKINSRQSTVSDPEIQLFLAEKSLSLMLLFMSHSLIGVNSITQKL